MAITKVNNFAPGDVNLTAVMTTLNRAYKGKADITISNYDNDSAPVVKVGSVFDCNGAIYIVDTSDITPTGYAGISNSTTFYLYFDESAVSFIYSSTAPTWSDSFQGWYNGNDRALFSMYKDSSGTLYQNKAALKNLSDTRSGSVKFVEPVELVLYYEKVGLTTYGEVFTALDKWIPTTNDWLPLSGNIDNFYAVLQARRVSSTQIDLSVLHITTISTISCTSGGGGTLSSAGVRIYSNDTYI